MDVEVTVVLKFSSLQNLKLLPENPDFPARDSRENGNPGVMLGRKEPGFPFSRESRRGLQCFFKKLN